ncbi:phage portal protein, SPP1 family [Bacillus safensis FO-36b]|uniref:phage portal protein n=1 Tax=Bacillus safensis TaxID=561879 RepID=UPI00045D0EE6|nr:phage portal protein [Bacillus safensis]KDE26691.1 phage portal protein, SPP1 family [Bacillus safensis FO-36b]MCM3050262.1 phage portal protein [Bacillus safensis]MEC1048592.1 phage portal protein [Bacillus safensis]
MYPTSPTHTEELIKIIKDSAETSDKLPDTTILQKLIDKHAVERDQMLEGVAYYLNQADIKKRVRYYYKHGVKMVDTDKPNNRISHNWHKLLVQQKVQYLLGKPITFNAEDETFLAVVNDFIDEDFDDCMQELLKNASNKGKEWLHPFVDEEGNFDYLRIPAEEVIPIYDSTKKRSLLYAIRYYDVKNIEDEITRKVELYTDEQIFYYVEHNGSLIQDFEYEKNPESHFYDKEGNGYGWGKVPLIEFKNNEEGVSDLIFYKDLIDQYNNNISNNANTFDEMQDLIYVLRNFAGQDLSEFTTNLRHYKAVEVSGDGGLEMKSAEIPMDSANSHLDRLEENIYRFGQGVNNNPDKVGNSPTNVAIKNLYSLLDLKANEAERKFRPALSAFFWFFTEYLKMTGQGEYDPTLLQMTFNRSRMTNELEQVQMSNQSTDLSRETRIANHPWVDDVEAELKRIEAEEAEYRNSMPPLTEIEPEAGGDEDEPKRD